MKKTAILLILAFLINISAPLSMAQEDEDALTANDKFTRSVVNIATFYLEVPMSVYKTSKDENPVTGILYGLTLGVAKGLVRLAVGVIELGTFPFEPYEPLLEPEFLMFER